MQNIRKTTFNVWNGSGYDTIYLKTSADLVVGLEDKLDGLEDAVANAVQDTLEERPSFTIGPVAPENPKPGDIWFDTSEE